MSNAKRAIMVPVMTLAVCAIAMVGLGFALTTSVTSSSNDVETLMIDLDSIYDEDSNGNPVGIKNQNEPDGTDVNSLFDFAITSDKTSTTNTDTTAIIYKVDSEIGYLKVFSNITDKEFTLKVKTSSLNEKITAVTLGLYNVNESNGKISGSTSVASAQITNNGTDAEFTSFSGKEGTVYIVKVDGITISETYGAETVNITYTSSGTTITKVGNSYSIGSTPKSNMTGFPKIDIGNANLDFTFTAFADRVA